MVASRVLVCLTFLMSFASIAGAGEPLRLTDDVKRYSIGLYSDYLEDVDHQWTIGDVGREPISGQFIPLNKEFPSFGFTQSAYWFRIQLENQTGITQNLLLENEVVWIDLIEVYVQKDNGESSIQSAGDTFPFYDREIAQPELLFNIRLNPGQTATLYIYSHSIDPLILPLTLWKESAFATKDRMASYLYGFVFGALVVACFYHLFLFFSLRDKSYLYYVFFLVVVILFIFSYRGFSYQYFWPNTPWASQMSTGGLAALVWYFSILFTRQFLDTRTTFAKLDKLLSALAVISLAYATLLILIPISLLIPLIESVLLLSVLIILLLLTVAFMAWRKGNLAARYFLLAWAILSIGNLTIPLISLGVLQYTFFYAHIGEIGYVLNAVFLSFALGDRINLLQREKNEAQASALEHENRARESLQKSKEELEVRVLERTTDLQKQKERAEEATKLKDHFVSLVAHDMRSPLSSVSSMLGMALTSDNEKNGEKQVDFISRSKEACERLLEMLDEMLDVNRIKSGKIGLSVKRYDALKLVNYYVLSLIPLADEKGVKMIIDIPEKLKVSVDMKLFGQVVQNLTSNAIKFCNDGDTVTIFSPKNNGAVIAVKDTGMGIEKSILPDLFNPDVKTTRLGAAGEKGTGIGLTLCKTIIDAHEGAIRVESVEGEGSVFYIDLPEEEIEAE